MAVKKVNPLLEAKKRKEEIERLTNQAKNIEINTAEAANTSDYRDSKQIGRPRSKKTEKVTVVMEPEDLKKFKRLCFESGQGMSEYIKKWLSKELEV